MPFTVEDSSGDVYIAASGPTAGDALVDLARAFSSVVTGGGKVEEGMEVEVGVTARDPSALIVAFINELVFRFDAERFLPAGGRLEYVEEAPRPAIRGSLTGPRYDPDRHGRGVEVKAATFHRLLFAKGDDGVRLRVLLDL